MEIIKVLENIIKVYEKNKIKTKIKLDKEIESKNMIIKKLNNELESYSIEIEILKKHIQKIKEKSELNLKDRVCKKISKGM